MRENQDEVESALDRTAQNMPCKLMRMVTGTHPVQPGSREIKEGN